MDHKAYPLDFEAFERDLAPILRRALHTASVVELQAFVEHNLADLKHPAEGTPLDADWQELVEPEPGADPLQSVQQWGDLALTRFYDPNAADGLSTTWEQAEAKLEAMGLDGVAVVLGQALGSDGRVFDPGLQGAYFQSPAEVQRNLDLLGRPELASDSLLGRWRDVLATAAAAGKGLYVTF